MLTVLSPGHCCVRCKMFAVLSSGHCCVREVILKKKLLSFGHCPKVAPPTRFGHPWGNFCLNRYRKNIQLKTTSNNLKQIIKLPQNYQKLSQNSWNMVNPPPLFLNIQKKAQPKLPTNFWTRTLAYY